jgi:hypothetical protein
MIKIFILSCLIDFIVLILMNVTSGNPFQTFVYLTLQIGVYVISLFDELMISLEQKFFLAVIGNSEEKHPLLAGVQEEFIPILLRLVISYCLILLSVCLIRILEGMNETEEDDEDD